MDDAKSKEVPNYNNVSIIVLAAGKGTRLLSKPEGVNKTAMSISGQPIISRVYDRFASLGIGQVIVVVGYAKESVINALEGKDVEFAQQPDPMGTGHAVECALPLVKVDSEYIVVVNGDDSFKYQPEVYEKLIAVANSDCAFAFLTGEKDDPSGLGRVIRNENGDIIGIVEEKNATVEQKDIKEINMGMYCFKRDFLKKFISQIPLDQTKQEKYITTLVDIAIANGYKIIGLKTDINQFCGVNTDEDLAEARGKVL